MKNRNKTKRFSQLYLGIDFIKMPKTLNKFYYGIHYDPSNYAKIIDAIHTAKKSGANALQIFLGDLTHTTLTKKYPFTDDEILSIKKYLKENNMKMFIHGLLRLNFCFDPNSKRYEWQQTNLEYDLKMANKLGAEGVVIHFGYYQTKDQKYNLTKEDCYNNYAKTIEYVLKATKKNNSKSETKIILETSVGKPNTIGGKIQDIDEVYKRIGTSYKKRVMFCIDTCHIFAAGYNIRYPDLFDAYMNEWDKKIGINKIALFHLNDSEGELGSTINRHISLGNGQIYKDNLAELEYIIHFAKKHNIALITETRTTKSKEEKKMIREMSTNKFPQSKLKQLSNNYRVKQGGSKKNIKPLCIKIFKEVLAYHEKKVRDGANNSKQTIYRIQSYKKVIATLEHYKKPIYSGENVKGIPSIGKSFQQKIDEIAKTGTLDFYEVIQREKKEHKENYEMNDIIQSFERIWGVGPQTARKWYAMGITSVNQIKNISEKDPTFLTEQQKTGLKYYNDLQKKIPRKEIKYFKDILSKSFDKKNIEIEIAGSYRMGKKESSDIDLIFICPDEYRISKCQKMFLEKIKSLGIYKDILVEGKNKFIMIVELPDSNKKFKPHISHQMDIIFIKKDELPWYLLYFGSSQSFSRKIRLFASQKGYKLNDKGLFDKKTGRRIPFYPKSEKEIFDFLEYPYVKPENRF